jgi:hypothetical protein
MLCREELLALQGKRDYPSISILAPTHRTHPSADKDPIVVKNLVAQALTRLHAEFTKREVAAVVKNLESLVSEVDWEHNLEGLALFASQKKAVAVKLPFRVKARFHIDETFATRDLVFTLNRAPRYRVLVLAEKPTRLFDASTNLLAEHTDKPFPLVHRGPGGASKLPGGKGINISATRDDAHRQFFRRAAEAIEKLNKEDKLPLVVFGVDRNLAFFQEVSTDPDNIVALVRGSHEETSASQLGKMSWPAFQAGSTQKRTNALVRLDAAVSANRHASGIAQVWKAAAEKRCQVLLVETGFAYRTDVAEDGIRLLPYTGQGAAALDDAVDELIEMVLASGGEVFFFDSGTLDTHQRIAAIVRF